MEPFAEVHGAKDMFVGNGSERCHESASTAVASPFVVVWRRKGVAAPAVSRVKEERW
jgi:hypothetical protein